MVAHAVGPTLPSCKRHGGVLEQENSANPPVDVTGNPKTFLVAADEKCRNRLVDDAGIERPKLCGDGRGLIGWSGFSADRLPARSQRSMVAR